MVAQPGERKRSMNAGELSPDLGGAVDIKQYWSAGLAFKNVEPVPQSGFRQMAGSVDLGPVRGRFATHVQTSPTTNLGPHTGTVTIYQATVAAAVSALYVTGLGAAASAHTAVVEIFVGAAWVQVGPAVAIGTTAKTRLFARAPGAALAATAIRIRVTFSTSDTATLTAVSVFTESATVDIPRYATLIHDSGERYHLSLGVGFMDIFLGDAFSACVFLPEVTAALLPRCEFYAENATVGVFHRDMETRRVRRFGAATEWEVDNWPYDGIPEVDLGGVYAKTDDVWEIFVTAANIAFLYMSIQVDGEDTPAVPFRDGSGDPVEVTVNWANDTWWDNLADELQTALRDLPSLGPDVTVTVGPQIPDYSRKFTVTFAGELSGREYQVSAQIANTANISALPFHSQIGDTEFEPLLSAGRGWPGVTGLVQDRIGYGDILAVPGAILFSEAAEYFTVNIEAAGATAARLDKLRAGQTAERVLAIFDASYPLIFTDQAVHFAANRLITKSDPLNITRTAAKGIVANTQAVELEDRVYYIAVNRDQNGNETGHQVYSGAYDEIASKVIWRPESLLASHLVEKMIRSKRQQSTSDQDADRMWMLRQDGRLICAQIIASQEILGFCEWVPAAAGLVREIEVDGTARLRMAVARGAQLRHERQDRDIFLQAALTRTADLAGVVDGLDLHEGRSVWAVAEGYVLGPFTVEGGEIDLQEAYAGDILVGLWQPPWWESMPRYRILPNDDMIVRPGRIHAVDLNLIDTTSIAVGANGQPARSVPLARTSDPVDQPTPARTGNVTVNGMLGFKTGTTLTVTQTKPGKLRVRDLVIQEKL